MNATAYLTWLTSDRVRRSFLRVVFGACVVGYANAAFAQYSTGLGPVSSGAPHEPPLSPPVDAPLPTGQGMSSIGPFLLSPVLGTYTFYNSNIYSSPTNRLSGFGFRIRPSKLYGNVNSGIYPTLNSNNDTFYRQAGAIESYSPLPDLTFTGQFNYNHGSTTSVIPGSALPTPIISPANPALPGAPGVVAVRQSVVNPNDTYTATFNAAYLDVGGAFLRQVFPNTPAQDFDQRAYYGSGGAWLTPFFYAYAQAVDSNSVPQVGSIANSYVARAGIRSAQLLLFKGTAYYGHQGTAIDGDGKAGGNSPIVDRKHGLIWEYSELVRGTS